MLFAVPATVSVAAELAESRPEVEDVDVLDEIARRVLWLAVRIVDSANHDRATRRRHQGGRAPGVERVARHRDDRAVVRAPATPHDRVAVKPHASPVFHAIQYLLGRARPGVPHHAARPRRPAVVPEPHEGPGRGGLLDRLGRPRRRSRRCSPPPSAAMSTRTSAAARAAGSSRSSATPSSTRATSGRPSSTPRRPGSATRCGSSTSTASRSTGSCPACGSRSGAASSRRPAGTWSR